MLFCACWQQRKFQINASSTRHGDVQVFTVMYIHAWLCSQNTVLTLRDACTFDMAHCWSVYISSMKRHVWVNLWQEYPEDGSSGASCFDDHDRKHSVHASSHFKEEKKSKKLSKPASQAHFKPTITVEEARLRRFSLPGAPSLKETIRRCSVPSVLPAEIPEGTDFLNSLFWNVDLFVIF